MKQLKFTPEQRIRFMDSYQALQKVLNQIKQESLEGQALVLMKELESAVQSLEAVALMVAA